MVNLINNIKDKAIEIKDTAVNFCKEHKEEVILGTALTIATCGCAYFGIKYHTAEAIIDEKNNIIKGKDSIINNLKKDNANYSSQLKVNELIINNNREQINSLKKLCNGKDEVMDFTMSDGFRHGSPECARQMAYKRRNFQA